MAILVTGGAGYIGSHTCVALLEAGEDIVVLDNFSNADTDSIAHIKKLTGKSFPVYATDILHAPGLKQLFNEQPIEAVIHFAGMKAVGESVRIPLHYYTNNVTGTLNLCQAMSEADCKRMVFSSSATVYGMDNTAPYQEDMPLPAAATNPYGTTKLMIEQILRDLHVSDSEWRVSLLRYFNPVGAHPSGLLGEKPGGRPNNLMPYITQVAVGKLPELNVCGNDYPTKDGTGVRDYLHVCDLAEGHVLALDYIRNHEGVEAVNLGTGTGYSVMDVIGAFEQANGVTIPYCIAPRRPGDLAVSYADASKALRLLDWKAKRSLPDMCGDAWRFEQRNAETIPV